MSFSGSSIHCSASHDARSSVCSLQALGTWPSGEIFTFQDIWHSDSRPWYPVFDAKTANAGAGDEVLAL